ncbi:aconitase/3-isopropylmalate dehydratase large subunit family protein [Pollutimonas bauzanensis]|uniref:3-isopropylmalate/(R)-2-methylmalate dehydratase large subunit n=1 Tax=Pollutimonas bauzanensis TaxID=658167 RepID=A0A1M5YYZ6_9BURK|nr:aconitase/3-isopropylmalate dehydratase large subunit family protein [Pollutimonas bauzanensis]SHI17185.1 3-isopropylmalate/(R)-2-methylmalate dehydratase large subunit [Pollutimonas bauzanensis]
MGQTIAQKILARASGRDRATLGEIIWAVPDVVINHDHNFPRYLDALDKMGLQGVASPEKQIVSIDHRPYSDDQAVVRARERMRKMAGNGEIAHFFDLGNHGISHNVPVDQGLVKPGQLVIASDSRAPALGCVGALSIALGQGQLTVLVTGKAWLRVPSTIKVIVTGKPRPGVMSRDIATWVAAGISDARGDYRVLEFYGDTIDAFGLDERHTLCNVCVDIGVKGAIVPPDGLIEKYLARFGHTAEFVYSDADAPYEEEMRFDISNLEPQIALPPDPMNIRPVSQLQGQKVNQVFIGSCIGGKLEDLRAAAQVLKGHKVHPSVHLLVIPATAEIHRQALAEGLIGILAAANANIAVGACGPCYGTIAPLAGDEVCVATSTRNENGRMGSVNATVLLASAATAAATAIRGVVTDPRELLA